MKKRIVFIKDGLFQMVAPEYMSEKYTAFDCDIIDVYTLEELEEACIALRLDFEGISGWSVSDALNLSEEDQFEVYESIWNAIKEAVD